MLICQYVCYCCRPGSIRADAFRGHGLSLHAPARGMPTLSAKDGFSRPSLKPVPASSSNASEYASSAQGNKEVYSSSPHSAGSSDTCWDCALLVPSKTFVPANVFGGSSNRRPRSQRAFAPNTPHKSKKKLFDLIKH